MCGAVYVRRGQESGQTLEIFVFPSAQSIAYNVDIVG